MPALVEFKRGGRDDATEFHRQWRNVKLKERSASQSHFNDLCRMLGLADPITEDPEGEWFTVAEGKELGADLLRELSAWTRIFARRLLVSTS